MEYISIGTIRDFIEIHAVIVYLIIFLGVVFEGEIVVVFAGIFSYLGSINPFIALIFIILGGATKSVLGYTIGYFLEKHHSHRPIMNRIERRISYMLPLFKRKPFWSIFLSRFLILGIGWFTLIFSGYKKIPLNVYIRAELCSLSIWSTGVLAIGYFFSYTALSVSRDVKNIVIIILVLLIGFFIFEKIVALIVKLFNSDNLDNNIEK